MAKCKTPGCKTRGDHSRGVCQPCYITYSNHVRTGKITWAELEAARVVLPTSRKQDTPAHKAIYKILSQ